MSLPHCCDTTFPDDSSIHPGKQRAQTAFDIVEDNRKPVRDVIILNYASTAITPTQLPHLPAYS